MHHHVTPPISAYHDLNRDKSEPNLCTLPRTPAPSASDRTPARATGPVGQDPRQGARPPRPPRWMNSRHDLEESRVMTVHQLSRADARRIAVSAQLLDSRRPSGLLDVVRHLTM